MILTKDQAEQIENICLNLQRAFPTARVTTPDFYNKVDLTCNVKVNVYAPGKKGKKIGVVKGCDSTGLFRFYPKIGVFLP